MDGGYPLPHAGAECVSKASSEVSFTHKRSNKLTNFHTGRRSQVERYLILLRSNLTEALHAAAPLSDAVKQSLSECDRLLGVIEAGLADDVPQEVNLDRLAGVSPEVDAWLQSHWTEQRKLETRLSREDFSGSLEQDKQEPDNMSPAVPFISADLKRLIEQVGTYDVDVVAISKQPEVGGSVLTVLFMYAFKDAGLHSKLAKHLFKTSTIGRPFQEKLFSFMKAAEEVYLDMPYHNSRHAADVAMISHWFFQSPELQSMMTPLDQFMGLVGACIHDLGHDGVNNLFHVKTQSQVAIRYNDKSVLENMHVSLAFEMMREQEDLDWFSMLTTQFQVDPNQKALDLQQYVRKGLIEMILATDTVRHNQLMDDLKAIVSAKGSFQVNADLQSASAKSKQDMMNVILHAADVSNPTRPLPIALYWSRAVLTEFWAQGDEERRLGLEVSPLCDRTSGMASIPQGQMGFVNFIVRPLFLQLEIVIPKVQVALAQLQSNMDFWQIKKEEWATFDQLFAALD